MSNLGKKNLLLCQQFCEMLIHSEFENKSWEGVVSCSGWGSFYLFFKTMIQEKKSFKKSILELTLV